MFINYFPLYNDLAILLNKLDLTLLKYTSNITYAKYSKINPVVLKRKMKMRNVIDNDRKTGTF